MGRGQTILPIVITRYGGAASPWTSAGNEPQRHLYQTDVFGSDDAKHRDLTASALSTSLPPGEDIHVLYMP